MSKRAQIACLGAGRMARGIAVAFAYAGHRVLIVDVKERAPEALRQTAEAAHGEVRATFASLAEFGLFAREAASELAQRVAVVHASDAPELAACAAVFEAVPEIPALKRDVLSRISPRLGQGTVLASTSSTILVEELAPAVARPERFLNAHWLNPAFLVPLVELSPAAGTDAGVLAALKGLLESIGKVVVVCAARPGYIVPRIQALAMNEAARMVEEGVASAAEIDKAIKYGFAFRFANLGMLEFIDWGGGDILDHASSYLVAALGDRRYAAPPIVGQHVREGRLGLRTGRGFFDYRAIDREAYRRERLKTLAEALRAMGLARPPVLAEGEGVKPLSR
jgi:3-hydroxybutyryl-CoA dehydrogenase